MTEEELLIGFAQADFNIFCTAIWPTYASPPHLVLTCKELMAVEDGTNKRVIFNMPPRYGKSLTCTQLFAAWYFGKHPDRQIIVTSYGQDIAVDFGRTIRNVMDSPQYQKIFPGVLLREDSQAANRFLIQPLPGRESGTFTAAGRGGPITGRGAHLLLLDDMFKDEQEAASETIRRQLWEWYQTVAYTRLMPDGAIVHPTTRWHVADLAGQMLQEQPEENWRVVCFPALSKGSETDLLKRPEGECLWQARFPQHYVEQQRNNMEARFWLALFQQEPAIDGGYKFKKEWWRTFKDAPERIRPGCNVYIIVDPANSKKKTSDSTVMWVVALSPDGHRYVLDGVWDRLSLSGRIAALMRLHRTWHPLGVGYETYGMQSDIEAIRHEQERINYRFDIIPLGGKIKKYDRISTLEPQFRQGELLFPEQLFYTDCDKAELNLTQVMYEREYIKYPAVKHDDGLDCLARMNDEALGAIFPALEGDPYDFQQQVEDFKRNRWRPRESAPGGTGWGA